MRLRNILTARLSAFTIMRTMVNALSRA